MIARAVTRGEWIFMGLIGFGFRSFVLQAMQSIGLTEEHAHLDGSKKRASVKIMIPAKVVSHILHG